MALVGRSDARPCDKCGSYSFIEETEVVIFPEGEDIDLLTENQAAEIRPPMKTIRYRYKCKSCGTYLKRGR